MGKLPISIEFFPPKDAPGIDHLLENVANKFSKLNPEFFSVTYGAGGSTRDGTEQTIKGLIKAGYDASPHLSMGLDDEVDLRAQLDRYRAMGVTRIVALRGDQPSGFGSSRFVNNAEALVDFVREYSGNHFDLVVAAYPEVHPDAESAAQDMDFFASKVAAGANHAITQYFYNADAYEYFLEQCAKRNISIPIVAGIMPITGYASLVRFSERCGAEIPRWLKYKLASLAEEDVPKLGQEVVTRLCEKLIAIGAPALHFYCLNRWGQTTKICQNLHLV